MSREPANERTTRSTQYTLHIDHCSDAHFLDRFRFDLVNAAHRVVVLSPFLSNNRAFHYYPVFMSLTARGVKVDVYAKPANEQPTSLRDHYGQVELALMRAGVRLHNRAGMHEKISIIDDQILWHGSLNILSHNDTRESMLRFESADLVDQVLGELVLSSRVAPSDSYPTAGFPQAEEAYADTRSPTCPVCSGRMISFEDAGLWICENSPKCSGSLSTTALLTSRQSEAGKMIPEVKISCPVCDAPMQVSRGIFLRVACSSEYCGFSLDPRIASSLLRVLKRKGIA
jgi:ribosomal protein L37AE/L43A